MPSKIITFVKDKEQYTTKIAPYLLDSTVTHCVTLNEFRACINAKIPNLIIIEVCFMDNELLDYCRKNKTKVIVFFPLIKPPYLFSLVEQYECDYILQELKPKELLQNQVALPTKIFLPFATGFEIVEFSQIIYVEAADNFSIFITKVGNFRVAKTLKKYEVALQAHDFQRVSRQHLVNLHYIERCNSTILYLWGKSQVELSKSYKEAFLEAMTKIVIFVV